MPTPAPGTEHVTFAVSGMHGGRTVDFRRFAASGMTLVGRADGFENGVMSFADDLQENIAHGDRNYFSVLDEADAYVARTKIDLPDDPEARRQWPDPDCLTNPIRKIDLADAGITSVVWATGFGLDFGWLDVGAFDEKGRPDHMRGISKEPGVYFLGLPWQSKRGSTFIWGVWHDAKFIGDQIAIPHAYGDYTPDAAATAAKETAQQFG